MYEWNETVQTMIDWIEAHLTEAPTLLEMSRQIGYSPFYCSSQFHRIVGVTLKTYVARRRISLAALALRDTHERILDIALQYGYSSQEAFTRAFAAAYGCTPRVYRQKRGPLPFYPRQTVYRHEHYERKGEPTMNQTVLTEPNVRAEYIPAHKYMGIWDAHATDYCSFWSRHDCDEVCGLIDSMSHVSHPVVTCHTAGWTYVQGERRYFYGLGVPLEYDGAIPEGFSVREFPASYYLVFYHPPFDYLKDCGEVMRRVEALAWGFDPAALGYAWNEVECQIYQRHYPEKLGYEVLRPVKPLGK